MLRRHCFCFFFGVRSKILFVLIVDISYVVSAHFFLLLLIFIMLSVLIFFVVIGIYHVVSAHHANVHHIVASVSYVVGVHHIVGSCCC
jgi:hypothetical protein